nr:MAG TPA: hypothetical protein [Caudoviricetes sp.]
MNKKRTPVMFGVLLRYADLINIIIGEGLLVRQTRYFHNISGL